MLDKLTKDLISKCIIEFKKKENKDRINHNIIDPLIRTISCRIYPYVTLLFIMYSIILILVILILILVILNGKK